MFLVLLTLLVLTIVALVGLYREERRIGESERRAEPGVRRTE